MQNSPTFGKRGRERVVANAVQRTSSAHHRSPEAGKLVILGGAAVDDVLGSMDSESTVDEHIEMLEKLAKRANIPKHVMASAIEAAEERKDRIESRSVAARSPAVKNIDSQSGDSFDDTALNNLFAPLRLGAS